MTTRSTPISICQEVAKDHPHLSSTHLSCMHGTFVSLITDSKVMKEKAQHRYRRFQSHKCQVNSFQFGGLAPGGGALPYWVILGMCDQNG